MAQVWVQVWSAQVPQSVQVEESALRQVVGDFQKMIPMVVQVEERVQEQVQDLVQAEEKVEVLPPLEMVSELEKAQLARETALSKGWGWVLREKE